MHPEEQRFQYQLVDAKHGHAEHRVQVLTLRGTNKLTRDRALHQQVGTETFALQDARFLLASKTYFRSGCSTNNPFYVPQHIYWFACAARVAFGYNK